MKLTRLVFRLIKDVFDAVLVYLPGESGIILRRLVYSRRFRSCGKNLRVGCNVKISGFNMIDVGDDVELKDDATILTGPARTREIENRLFLEVSDYSHFSRGRVVIGDYTRISFGALVLGFGGVKIGKKCAVGIGAKVITETTHYAGPKSDFLYKPSGIAPPKEHFFFRGIVTLEDGATIAANAIAFPGSTVGKDSWVLANSVVPLNRKIPLRQRQVSDR